MEEQEEKFNNNVRTTASDLIDKQMREGDSPVRLLVICTLALCDSRIVYII